MKKTNRALPALLIAAILFSLFSFTAAADSQFECIPYTDADGKTRDEYVAMKYSGNGAQCLVPKEIDGKPVSYIDRSAFDSSGSVTSVTIEGSPRSAIIREDFKVVEHQYLDYLHLYGLPLLDRIDASPESEAYSSKDGVLYSKDGKRLCQFPTGKKATGFVVPSSVEEIAPEAFKDCVELSILYLPKNLKKIGKGAFDNCTGMYVLYYPADGDFWGGVTNDAEIPDTCKVEAWYGQYPQNKVNEDGTFSLDYFAAFGVDDSYDFSGIADIEELPPDPDGYGGYDYVPDEYDNSGYDFADDLDTSSGNTGGVSDKIGGIPDGVGSSISSAGENVGSALKALLVVADVIGVFIVVSLFFLMRKGKANAQSNVPAAHIEQPASDAYAIGAQEISKEQQPDEVPESVPAPATGESVLVPPAEISQITLDKSPEPAAQITEESPDDYEQAQSYTGAYAAPDMNVIHEYIEGQPIESMPTADPAAYTGAYSGTSSFNVIHEYIEGQPIESMPTADPAAYTGAYTASGFGVTYNNPEDAPVQSADPTTYSGAYTTDYAGGISVDSPTAAADPSEYTGAYAPYDGSQPQV